MIPAIEFSNAGCLKSLEGSSVCTGEKMFCCQSSQSHQVQHPPPLLGTCEETPCRKRHSMNDANYEMELVLNVDGCISKLTPFLSLWNITDTEAMLKMGPLYPQQKRTNVWTKGDFFRALANELLNKCWLVMLSGIQRGNPQCSQKMHREQVVNALYSRLAL